MATYTIKSGDTLSAIATKQGTTVANLLKLNPSITDANKIYAGQALNLAAPAAVAAAAPVASATPDWQKTLADTLSTPSAQKAIATPATSTPAGPISTPYTPATAGASYRAPGTPAPISTPTPVLQSPLTVPQTPAPNMSTNLGPARGNPDGSVTYATPQGAVTVPASALSMNSTPAIPAVTTPITQDVPGVGTLTRVPKSSSDSLIAPPAANSTAADAGVPSGLFERTGVSDPNANSSSPSGAGAGSAGSGAGASASSGMGTIPNYGPAALDSSPQASVMSAYTDLTTQISDIEKKLADSATPTDEEKKLAADLVAKKAALAQFDQESLQRLEAFQGQGRGATASNVAARQDVERRTRALERLGLSNDAELISNTLGLAQDQRKALGDSAQMAYSLATKRFDLAMGLTNEMQKLNSDDQDHARQYLLDVVSFSKGKTWAQLDQTTQQQIIHSVANSPITLDMVKTALDSSADKDTTLTPEEAKSYGVPYGTTKGQLMGKIASTGTGSDVLSPSEAKLYGVPYGTTKAQISGKYAPTDTTTTNPDLGKLTPTDKSTLTQAKLTGAPSEVQSYFLNTPAEFQDQYKRSVATGSSSAQSVDQINAAYTQWYNEQQAKKSSASHDWSALLGGG